MNDLDPKVKAAYANTIERMKNDPGYAKKFLYDAGITDEDGELTEFFRPDPTPVTIYYEDVDALTVSMMELMEEWAKKYNITLSDVDDLDTFCKYMDDNFRDKYSCGRFKGYN